MKKIILLIVLILSIQSFSQKISVLFEYQDIVILSEADTVFDVSIIKVTDMLPNMWNVVIEPTEVTDFEDYLKSAPDKMIFIGSYNSDGSQYVWTEPQELVRNHSINKYKNSLKDIVEYDENGDETSKRRPTENEALNTQVNKVYGWNDRNIQ